jgi:hypothetical protein
MARGFMGSFRVGFGEQGNDAKYPYPSTAGLAATGAGIHPGTPNFFVPPNLDAAVLCVPPQGGNYAFLS